MPSSLMVKRVFLGLVAITALSAPATLAPAIDPRAELDDSTVLDSGLIYRLERDGVVTGYFKEVSGLSSETEVVEYRDGSSGVTIKIPGAHKFGNVTLKRGITRDLTWWNWRQEVVSGAAPRSDLTITLMRRLGGPIAVWHLTDAWPVKISGPSFDTGASEVPIEEITIVHEYITRVQ